MKKLIMVMVFGLVSLVSAQQEWISFTGKVIKARAGQEGTTFYTLQRNDTGEKYEANTKRPDVLQNEAKLKEALDSGRMISIEFNVEDKWPGAVWHIRKIQILDSDTPVVTIG